jgi:CHAD domain-containing protein
MVPVSDPRRLARKRLLALACQLPLAAAGEEEGVHQARVASRRLRELLPLLAWDDRRDEVERLRKQVRGLTRGLGPVRELDVARLRLDGLVAQAGPHAAASATMLDVLRAARAETLAAMREAIDDVSLDKVRRLVADAAAAAAHGDTRRRLGCALGDRLERRGMALVEALEAAGIVYAPDRLHRVRVAMKKFRYAIELAQDLGRVRLRGSVSRLKRLQAVLGDLHDDELLAAKVRDIAAGCHGGTRHGVETLADFLDGEVRRHHSRFLNERESLPAVFRWTRRAAAALKGSEP